MPELAVTTRNAMLDAIETDVGASPILKLRTGARPATAADADTGTVVCTMTLPADFMAAAAAGVKSKAGVWEDLLADVAGVIGHYRLYVGPAGTVCKIQGSVTLPGAGGEMTLINTNVAVNQPVTISTYDITAANA